MNVSLGHRALIRWTLLAHLRFHTHNRLPLTVSLENVATSHDGTNTFTFEIRFSEQFGLS